MSRKGKTPLNIPSGVDLKFVDGKVSVSGPKGNLSLSIFEDFYLEIQDKSLFVRSKEEKSTTSKFLGLFRSLISNMLTGVSEGFEKKLELVGVGYRASIKGKFLDLQLGFSHPTQLPIPDGINVIADLKSPIIVISGADKQLVGQFAADVRFLKKPEPYQGKGVRYVGEILRSKAGKSGKSGKKK